MTRLRFSISSLILLVGLSATGFAAIHLASPGWAGGLFSLSIVAMLTALLGVSYRRGPKRVYWVGFALFGWTHLVLAGAPWFSTWVGPQLFGAKLFSELYPVVHSKSASAMGAGMGMGGMGGMGGGMGGGFRQMGLVGQMGGFGPVAPAVRGFVSRPDFLRIGQSLEALLWGVLGGWIARYLASEREPSEPRPAAPEAGTGPDTPV